MNYRRQQISDKKNFLDEMINEIAGLTGNTITPQSELLTDITSEIMVCILQE